MRRRCLFSCIILSPSKEFHFFPLSLQSFDAKFVFFFTYICLLNKHRFRKFKGIRNLWSPKWKIFEEFYWRRKETNIKGKKTRNVYVHTIFTHNKPRYLKTRSLQIEYNYMFAINHRIKRTDKNTYDFSDIQFFQS